MAEDLKKRFDELEKLVQKVDFTLENNTELLEMQTDLVSDLQQLLYDKQMDLDTLRKLREQTQYISVKLVNKVKKEREQKKEHDKPKPKGVEKDKEDNNKTIKK
jgi:nitrate/nitrite-specific signal transduction histidine kinase